MSLGRLIEAVEAGRWDHDAASAWLWTKPGQIYGWSMEAFGGSIDAAKRLHDALLPGWFPGLSQNVHSGFWFAWVQTKDEKHFSATEADPARAWLLAILRAKNEQSTNQE